MSCLHNGRHSPQILRQHLLAMRQRLKDLIGGIAVADVLGQLLITQRRLIAHHHVQMGFGWQRLGRGASQLLLLLLCQQLLGILIVSVHLLGGFLHRHGHLIGYVEAAGHR